MTELKKTTIITYIILFTWIGIVIAWERIAPYRKGLPFFRDGFWVDFVWYTIIQSYLLKILIFAYIIPAIQSFINWHGFAFFRSWSVTEQVLFFLVTHDLYI